jgi:hypothetical protein
VNINSCVQDLITLNSRVLMQRCTYPASHIFSIIHSKLFSNNVVLWLISCLPCLMNRTPGKPPLHRRIWPVMQRTWSTCVVTTFLIATMLVVRSLIPTFTMLWFEATQYEKKDFFADEIGTPGWKAFVKLLQNPYFTRVWVVQEIAVGSNVQLYHGGRYIPWDIFTIVRAFAIARRTPKLKPPPEQHLITSLTHFQIVQKLQDNVKNNKGLYFICFLCKFVRGEGVVRVVGGVVISLRCTTSSGESSYIRNASIPSAESY